MLSSMTGFGRALFDAPFGQLIVEIQSVNRKYLEIFVSLPKEFGRFEQDVRKWVQETVHRGQVTVRIHFIPKAGRVEEALPDVELLRSLKSGWEKISHQLGYDPKKIDLPFLLQYLPESSKLELARDEDLPALQRVVDQALQELVKMKKAEGRALGKDLSGRLKELEKALSQVEVLTPDSTGRMRQKLKEKIEELLKPSAELEERLLREVALFAEKVDVSEEITRLHSHLDQFAKIFEIKDGGVGRKMDFLVQEMGREINTIGSKSSEAKMAHLVVEMKSELEKMREQIQNIE